ncbi:MAG: bifunctional DNA primase/polymerase [Alphaproteobacteria bacterium]
MRSVLDAALAYAARSWPVLPCKARAKVPATPRGVHDATCDATVIRGWFANGSNLNVAIRTDGLFVLDVDGAEGEASLAALEREHGALPLTAVQLTPRGRHFVFRVADGLPVPNSASSLGPRLDVRGTGAYIVAAPSVHPCGRQYAWDVDRHPDEWPLADAPAAWLALARAPAKAKPTGDNAARENTGRLTEGQRNATLFRLACKLRRDALGADAILAAIEAENRERCDPPLDAAEVRAIAASASRYERGTERGAEAPSDDRPPLVARPLGDRDPAAIPPRRWVMGRRYLRGHVTLTIAPPGASKTTLALHEAVAIVTGATWAGQTVFEPGPVLYVGAEDDLDEIDRRIFAVATAMQADLSLVRARLHRIAACDRAVSIGSWSDRGAFLRGTDVDALITEARRIGAVLVELDPLADLHTVPENDNGAMCLVGAACREIAQSAGCAVGVVHHTRKPSAASAEGFAGDANAGRGASSLVGVARVVDTLYSMTEADAGRLGIDPAERHKYVRLDGAKANFALTGEAPRWFRRDATIIPNGETVGVLTPADMTGALMAAEFNQRDRYRTIIARLLVIVPDRLSVNQAGLVLIAQRGSLYPGYADRDFAGKCPATVRAEIEAAAASGITINGQGFAIVENNPAGRGANARARVLVRHVRTDDSA